MTLSYNNDPAFKRLFANPSARYCGDCRVARNSDYFAMDAEISRRKQSATGGMVPQPGELWETALGGEYHGVPIRVTRVEGERVYFPSLVGSHRGEDGCHRRNFTRRIEPATPPEPADSGCYGTPQVGDVVRIIWARKPGSDAPFEGAVCMVETVKRPPAADGKAPIADAAVGARSGDENRVAPSGGDSGLYIDPVTGESYNVAAWGVTSSGETDAEAVARRERVERIQAVFNCPHNTNPAAHVDQHTRVCQTCGISELEFHALRTHEPRGRSNYGAGIDRRISAARSASAAEGEGERTVPSSHHPAAWPEGSCDDVNELTSTF